MDFSQDFSNKQDPSGLRRSPGLQDNQQEHFNKDATSEFSSRKPFNGFEGEKQNIKPDTNSNSPTKKEKRFFSFLRFISYAALLCVVVTIVAMMSFLIFFRPAPVVSVPNLIGKNFVDSTLLLQEKQLYPVVVLQYTNDPLDKGKVIEQEPNPGMSIRSKRAVRVVVSQGSVVSDIADYVGRSFSVVQDEIQSQFAGFDTLLSIKNVEKIFNPSSDPLIVLAQSPKAGSKISGTDTKISFVVSRGDQQSTTKMPDLTGLLFTTAFDVISNNKAAFEFYITDRVVNLSTELEAKRKPAGFILEQIPPAGSPIREFLSTANETQRFRFGIRPKTEIVSGNEDEKTEFDVGILDFKISRSSEVRQMSVYKTVNGSRTLEYSIPVAQEDISLPYVKIPGAFYEVLIGDVRVFRYTVADEKEDN